MLERGDGHALWFETRGTGAPALVLHGGPGSGCHPGHWALFDTTRYAVTLMDQRGCGRSRPRAGDTVDALENNSTAHLIADIEALRQHLNVEAWVLFGGSWGSTLAMAYAQAHPDRVAGMVLAGVATTSPRDLRWLYGDVGNLFPEAYTDFCRHVPEASDAPEAATQRMAAYAARLRDPARAQAAADAWCTWEAGIFGGEIRDPASRYSDPGFRLCFARIVTHFFAHAAWLEPDAILKRINRIAHIPCHMIHSRFDPSAPLRAPWELAQAWPAAHLQILAGKVHSALDDDMRHAIRDATDRLADRLEM
ncbi:MAG: alpha/beta fold hydrolase [Pseudomonadota bacterium]